MRAKFIGDPRHDGHGPNVISFHGVDFPKGVWVDEIPEALFGKLTENSHFETEGGLVGKVAAIIAQAKPNPELLHSATTPPPAPEISPVTAETALEPEAASGAPAPISEPAPILPPDHDGDNIPGGSTASPEKDAVIAELKALGVDFDGRWGLTRLKAALEVAKFENGDD